jgi:hypothetical protein
VCESDREAHAILDPVENVDADAVQHSNSTYELAGVDASQPSLLYAKTLPCLCLVCRDPSSIRSVPPASPPSHTRAHTHIRTHTHTTPPTTHPYRLGVHSCLYWATTGRWRQHTVCKPKREPARHM